MHTWLGRVQDGRILPPLGHQYRQSSSGRHGGAKHRRLRHKSGRAGGGKHVQHGSSYGAREVWGRAGAGGSRDNHRARRAGSGGGAVGEGMFAEKAVRACCRTCCEHGSTESARGPCRGRDPRPGPRPTGQGLPATQGSARSDSSHSTATLRQLTRPCQPAPPCGGCWRAPSRAPCARASRRSSAAAAPWRAPAP